MRVNDELGRLSFRQGFRHLKQIGRGESEHHFTQRECHVGDVQQAIQRTTFVAQHDAVQVRVLFGPRIGFAGGTGGRSTGRRGVP